MEPISIVESKSFIQLMKALNNNFEVPSVVRITTMLNDIYKEKVTKLKNELSNCDCVSLTTDLWSSWEETQFVTISVHYIKDYKLHSYVLQTMSNYVSILYNYHYIIILSIINQL